MEHVSWTTSHTALYLLYQLVKVFIPDSATPSLRNNSRGTLTGCRSLRLSNHWAKLSSIGDILIEKNLRLLGHVHRMNNNRLPKKLLYFQLCLAMRNQWRPRLRFKYFAKRNMNWRDIDLNRWPERANDRPTWRRLIKLC